MSRTEVIDVTGAIERPKEPVTVVPTSKWVRLRTSADAWEIVVMFGMVLWVLGFWPDLRVALGVPGAVLVWWALPTRPPFVRRVDPEKG